VIERAATDKNCDNSIPIFSKPEVFDASGG